MAGASSSRQEIILNLNQQRYTTRLHSMQPGGVSHGTILPDRVMIGLADSIWDGQRDKMRDLRALREGWGNVAAEETRLLRDLTIEASARQLLRLQEAFEPQLQATAHRFAPQRWAALAELQARLQRLAEWQAQHEQSVHLDRDHDP